MRELAEGYALFEGSLLRGLTKLESLLREWDSMAALCGHLDVLDRSRDAAAILHRGVAAIESLYLRL
jgi:superfamily II RNA helicase